MKMTMDTPTTAAQASTRVARLDQSDEVRITRSLSIRRETKLEYCLYAITKKHRARVPDSFHFIPCFSTARCSGARFSGDDLGAVCATLRLKRYLAQTLYAFLGRRIGGWFFPSFGDEQIHRLHNEEEHGPGHEDE